MRRAKNSVAAAAAIGAVVLAAGWPATAATFHIDIKGTATGLTPAFLGGRGEEVVDAPMTFSAIFKTAVLNFERLCFANGGCQVESQSGQIPRLVDGDLTVGTSTVNLGRTYVFSSVSSGTVATPSRYGLYMETSEETGRRPVRFFRQLAGTDAASDWSPLLDPTPPCTASTCWGDVDIGTTMRFSIDEFTITTISAHALAVPEPGAWSLMLLGFGLAGAAVRRRAIAA